MDDNAYTALLRTRAPHRPALSVVMLLPEAARLPVSSASSAINLQRPAPTAVPARPPVSATSAIGLIRRAPTSMMMMMMMMMMIWTRRVLAGFGTALIGFWNAYSVGWPSQSVGLPM